MAPTWVKLAKSFEGKEDVVIAEVDCTEHATLCSKHGVQGYPTLVLFPKGGAESIKHEAGRELDNFLSWIEEKTGVTGERVVDVVYVQELTPATFDKVVMDAEKDVLVAFVAPWCGHCKRLHGDYDALAEVYRNDKSVVIARVNADEHRVLGQRFGVSGFPTLKLFRRGTADKEAEDFEGERSLDALLKYVGALNGAARGQDGRLTANAGRVAELDELAADFVDGDMDALLAQAEAFAAGHPGRSAKLYVHTMRKLKEDGAYAEREIARLSGMIESGMVPHDRLDDMSIRLNILHAFDA